LVAIYFGFRGATQSASVGPLESAPVIADYHFLINDNEETTMAWTTPTLVEICIGLEINGYLPAEF